MAGKEVREYTNLTDPRDKKLGKVKDRVDDEEITFQRMVAKMQEVAGERGGYLHGRGDIFSLTAKHKAVAETSPASVPLPLRVEPKPKSGIRQQDLLKRVVEVKPKRQRVSSPSDGKQSSVILNGQKFGERESVSEQEKEKEKNPFTG